MFNFNSSVLENVHYFVTLTCKEKKWHIVVVLYNLICAFLVAYQKNMFSPEKKKKTLKLKEKTLLLSCRITYSH